MKNVLLFLITISLFLVSESTAQKFVFGEDIASNHDPDWGDHTPFGFGSWTLTQEGSGTRGHFIGDSSLGGADINTDGKSFAMFAHGDVTATSTATLFFPRVMEEGDTFTFTIAMNFLGGNKGFDLRNDGTGVFNFQGGNGEDDFRVNGVSVFGRDGHENNIFTFIFTRTATGIDFEIQRSGDVTDDLTGSFTGIPNNIRFYNNNSGSATGDNLYLNNFRYATNDETRLTGIATRLYEPHTLGTDISVNSFTIQAGGQLALSDKTLTVENGVNFVNNSGGFAADTGKVIFQGSNVINGSFSFNNVDIEGGGASGVNFGTQSQLNGLLTLKGGSYVNTNAPQYNNTSTLAYDTGGGYTVGAEWPIFGSGNDPTNVVTISSSISFGAATDARRAAGDIDLTGGTLTLSTEVGGDLRVGGSLNIVSGLIPNFRAIYFDGGQNSVINPANTLSDFFLIVENETQLTLFDGRIIAPVEYTIAVNSDLIIRTQTGANFQPVNVASSSGEITFEYQLTGGAGWRTLTSPVETTYGQFFNNVWTQGFTGSNYEPGDANVFFWDPTVAGNDEADWVVIPGASAAFPAGAGALAYIWTNDDYVTPGSWPKTLQVKNELNSFPLTIDGVNINQNPGSFTFVGNPTGSTIASSDFSRTNIRDNIWAWNPSGPAYVTYNGAAGDLSGGLIRPFQGFFIESNAVAGPTTSLTMNTYSGAGGFYGRPVEDQRYIRLELSGLNMKSSTWFSFDDGEYGKDEKDVWKLYPLSNHFSLLATILEDGSWIDINNLPYELSQDITFPLMASSTRTGQYTITVTDFALPEEWGAYIYDHKNGSRYILDEGLSFDFFLDEAFPMLLDENELKPTNPTPLQSNLEGIQSVMDNNRFSIMISPLATDIPEENNLPLEFELAQNYPNPFNPTTNISFSLPESANLMLEIFNVQGQKVAVLLNDYYQSGVHTVNFNAENLASGIYIYRLTTNNTVLTRKMTLIK